MALLIVSNLRSRSQWLVQRQLEIVSSLSAPCICVLASEGLVERYLKVLIPNFNFILPMLISSHLIVVCTSLVVAWSLQNWLTNVQLSFRCKLSNLLRHIAAKLNVACISFGCCSSFRHPKIYNILGWLHLGISRHGELVLYEHSSVILLVNHDCLCLSVKRLWRTKSSI